MKVAVITQESNPWSFMVVEGCLSRGDEVLLVDVTGSAKRHAWMSWRFIRKRGLLAFFDLLLGPALLPVRAVKRRLAPRRPNADGPRAYADVLAKKRLEAEASGFRRGQVGNINGGDSLELLREFSPEVTILCGAPIVRKKLIEKVGLLINPHCGIVPEYKGSSPAHWAVYHGDWDKIGFTIHLVTRDVDGGPVLYQEKVLPQPGWTMKDLDWHLVWSMYEKLIDLIHQPGFRQQVELARPQEDQGRNWPPMGEVRKLFAERALKRHGKGARSRELSA